MMLFTPDFHFPLTPSAVKIQRENLKQFEIAHFSHYAVFELLENRTAFCDALLVRLWSHFELPQVGLALIAVGGYGRKEMFPLSDLDFLFLSERTIVPPTEEKIAQFVQFLWDCGFDVGHSVRTLEECETEGKEDVSIATNLLESRYLFGERPLFEQLRHIFTKPDFWDKSAFFEAKIKEQAERYQRYHNTSYNLEPDIKYSPGGLRDLHLIYWIALRHTGASTLEEILACGFIYPAEYHQLIDSQTFLFKVRFILHLFLKRYDNRLLFDRQIKVADMLGFQGEGNRGVEKMMKRFFQALRVISRLSDILIKHYREHFLSTQHNLPVHDLDEDFQLIGQSLTLRRPDIFLCTPARILDLFFYLTEYPEAEIHSSALRQLQLALESLSQKLCELPEARERFIRLFNRPNAIRRAFLPMHQYGVLTAYLPQWSDIEGLMQFDLFHIYTVDEHTLRVMLKLESFLAQSAVESHPICHRIFSRISDRTLLYIAALFHDIAKGRGGDHAELGSIEITEFAEYHGFDRREIETMAWLVKSHLLMSITAQRRDIHDPEVVLQFAESVKNRVRLDYLTCLTVADICATNVTLWNSWKRSLFAVLYDLTGRQFQQGMDILLDNKEKIRENREQALLILTQSHPCLSTDKILAFWQRCPADYFLRNSPKQIAWHTALLVDFNGDILVKISNRFSLGGTEVFIYCPDQTNLFHKVVCTIGAKKFSIHDAQILTADNGYVFDSFIITELDGTLARFDRRRELEEALTKALQSDEAAKSDAIGNYRLAHFSVKTEVRFLQPHKAAHTALELITLDKAGLLAEVSRIFSALKLNLLNAKIMTVGEKAEDFFILTNQMGQALTPEERQKLEQALSRL